MADTPVRPPEEPDYQPGAGQAQATTETQDNSGLFGVTSGSASANVGTKHTVHAGTPAGPLKTGYVPAETFETKTLGEMAGAINGLKPDELKALQDRLFNAGFYGSTKIKDISFGVADEATQDAWNQLLSRNARGVAAGNKSSWEETLADALKAHGVDDPTGDDGKFVSATSTSSDTKSASERSRELSQSGGVATSSTSSTSTDTKLSDPTTAHALIVKAMQDKLGRDPTDDELGIFRTALRDYETANPTVTKATETQSRTTKELTDTSGAQTTTGSSTTQGTQSQAETSAATAKPGETITDIMASGTTPANATTNQTSTSTDKTSSQDVNASSQSSNTVSDQGTTQSQNSTTSGGTNPADWAQFWVQEQNRPEMDEYHKATMYYNAALQVLGLGGRG